MTDSETMSARRRFLKAAAATVAGCAAGGRRARLLGREPTATLALSVQPDIDGPTVRLGNTEPPASHFQAYPGGTGTLMEKLWKESDSNPFERRAIEVAPWQGLVPSSDDDVAFLPVHRLAALLRAKHITSSELTEIYLTRLHRYDPLLLCAVTILADRAREEAAAADAEIRAGRWRGPLHGIPYGLKDVFAVRGVRTTWGDADFRTRVIDEDAEVVTRLRAAGAILVAKLATGRLARGDRWFRGRTKNPWNPSEGSSGSSAGPASATAAGCVGFSIGTETQGSIVSPARRCGVSALRPTFGRVSRHGAMVLAWSMDKTGPLCRSVEDCALVFSAIHGADEKDPASLTTPFHFRTDPDLAAMRIGFAEDAPESFVQVLRDLGAMPRPMPELPDGASNALSVESAAAFDFHLARDGAPAPLPAGLSQEARRRENRFRAGREVPALDYLQAQRRRMVFMREMATVMSDFDMFVSGSGLIGLTNQTGHPAVVVPYDFGRRDPQAEEQRPQPLTTTLIGNVFSDDKVLSVAHAFQAATSWHLERPLFNR